MKTIIENLLNQIELQNIDVEFGKIYYFSESNINSYWLILVADHINGILEDQTKYFTLAKEKINNEWFDKNASLLIIHKVDSINQVDKNKILKIEEDPYLFKKQILLYTESEKLKLQEAIEKSKLDVKQFLEKKLISNITFNEHKENLNNNDYQSLIYRMAYKIPFIRLNVNQENGMETLSKINAVRITNNNSETLNESLTDAFLNKNLNEISNLSTEEIYNNLLKILDKNENQQN